MKINLSEQELKLCNNDLQNSINKDLINLYTMRKKPLKYGEETLPFSIRLPKSRKKEALKAIYKALDKFRVKPKDK